MLPSLLLYVFPYLVNMRLAIFAAIVLVPAAYAQNISSVTDALNAFGLSSFVQATGVLDNSTSGKALLNGLVQGNNWTIFAPSNDAFSKAPPSLSSDPNLLVATLAYHVLPGSFASDNSSTPTLYSATSPNHTIARTMMNDSSYVNLQGASQVLVWTSQEGQVTILNQPTAVSILNSTHVSTSNSSGIDVYAISSVLGFPSSSSSVIANNGNLTSLAGLLNNAMIQSANGTNDTLANVLDQQKGVTVFAPTDGALQGAPLPSLSTAWEGNDQSKVINLLQNHILNGSSVYSTEVYNGLNTTSAAGEPTTFTTNSSGAFVNSGGTTAKILQTDVISSNGVVHVIDSVLLNTNADPAAASSAYASATSAAATQTGAIGAASTDVSSSTSNAQSSSGGRTRWTCYSSFSCSFLRCS
ncbi:FAS1 domain-containing protein [Rhodocollybia butyracea]|uniref:FAS1 domain-containing protein n=1 Tax=Rhodocollybia butyracea TaxID=206335 RepID=A0A9P5P7T8_9AGAR|nr:FAS1 domain-containing protein [Rhodocollybia butyracea]